MWENAVSLADSQADKRQVEAAEEPWKAEWDAVQLKRRQASGKRQKRYSHSEGQEDRRAGCISDNNSNVIIGSLIKINLMYLMSAIHNSFCLLKRSEPLWHLSWWEKREEVKVYKWAGAEKCSSPVAVVFLYCFAGHLFNIISSEFPQLFLAPLYGFS